MQKPTEPFRHCWVRFKSYQRDCPHHGFNEVQLLTTFFRGLDLTYQTALDTDSKGNFNTMNQEEAVRLIENLATSNSTKNTDYQRRKLANALGKEQLDDVKAELDSVNKLLRKQVSFAEDVEAIETDEERYEERVSCVGGFQRLGNQNGNMNFYGNSQRSNYNQNSQFQKPFSNSNYSKNKNLNNSFYQNSPPPTQESKIEAMLDSVLEGQQRLTVDFNGKIDAAYNSLNVKFDTLSTHVKKLETQVIHTAEAIQRQEALIKGREEDLIRHHINAIAVDEFWQVDEDEELQEGEFEVESSMSIGSSHWCRPTPNDSHRSTWEDDYRSMFEIPYRSTKSTESTATNRPVQVMIHAEFAARHPNPLRPFIDRSHDDDIDRQPQPDID
ncbi:hypothetical protein Bca4012_026017 [Brassica carinata]